MIFLALMLCWVAFLFGDDLTRLIVRTHNAIKRHRERHG